METCRHLRYQVPREVADELRDADPAPCAVCDALPHRRMPEATQGPELQFIPDLAYARVNGGWFNQLLSRMRKCRSNSPGTVRPVFPLPQRQSARRESAIECRC